MSQCPIKRKSTTGKNKEQRKRAKIETVPQRPCHVSDCDSNWKRLQIELQKTNPTKQRKKFTKRNSEFEQTAPKIWFDDVSQEELLLAEGLTQKSENSKEANANDLVRKNAFEGMTKAVAVDCEMVGIGRSGSRSVLARVSIVNQYGKRIYDKHVRVGETVTDYRTWVSGIRPSDLEGAEEFTVVQREVAEILKDRILVGHALHNDLKSLYISHPKRLIRDTSTYPPFRAHSNGKTPSLKKLSAKLLGIAVQGGEHSSVQDAQAAMKLYMMHKRQWEKELKFSKNCKQAPVPSSGSSNINSAQAV